MFPSYLRQISILLIAAAPGWTQTLSADLKNKVDAKLQSLKSWSSDPQFVSAVKAFNTTPPPEAAQMTAEKWTSLSLLDPVVRSFTKNELGQVLKAKKDPQISEIFVSGSNGAKVAFLSKTTSWSHRGKPKHDVPMSGKIWIGTPETDESTGQLQVQVGLPVLDGGKPIGSIVVGLSLAKL
jgi:hypothetical protein